MKTLLLVPLILSLQGCFFFYIPGSVIDSLVGGEGQHCVSETAKVGDKIRLQDNRIGVVKSLSGITSRCKNPNMPVRALLDIEDAK